MEQKYGLFYILGDFFAQNHLVTDPWISGMPHFWFP
jgi:hypothetical protein